ncbi:unnamed protein product [Arctogadus glacialis]
MFFQTSRRVLPQPPAPGSQRNRNQHCMVVIAGPNKPFGSTATSRSWAFSCVAPLWIGLFDENGCDQVTRGSSQSRIFDRLERVGAVLFKQDCVVRAIDRVKFIVGIAAPQAFGLGHRP